jgi:hypothetical protein
MAGFFLRADCFDVQRISKEKGEAMSATLCVTGSAPVRVPTPLKIGSAGREVRLQSGSHDAEIRREIGRAIREGHVRVLPMPGDPERVIVRAIKAR